MSPPIQKYNLYISSARHTETKKEPAFEINTLYVSFNFISAPHTTH